MHDLNGIRVGLVARFGWRALIGVVLVLTASGCGGLSDSAASPAAGRPIASGEKAVATPYRLYTHCGIDELKLGDEYFELGTPLHDGNGSPPRGWDNPYQEGTVTRVSTTEVEFRDSSGHVLSFRLRSGATGFKRICR